MKKLFVVVLLLGAGVGMLWAQRSDKISMEKTAVASSPWQTELSCGGLSAEVWSQGNGWHQAACLEVGEMLAKLRDVRSVTIRMGPTVADGLTYAQYENDFRIAAADFIKAQSNCRELLAGNSAADSILAQCRHTVAGVVPYGLQLKVAP